MADIENLKRLVEACDIENCADEDERDWNMNEFYLAVEPEDVAALIAENEALKAENETLSKAQVEKDGIPTIPPHLAGVADAVFTMTDNGEDPSDMLAMLEAGLKKAYREQPTESDQLKAENKRLQVVNAATLRGYGKLKAELERVKAQNENFADHMRALACRLGAGGYNAPEVDPDQFASKINGGIDMLVDPLVAELERVRKDAERYQWLRERGDACQWMNITRVDTDDYDSLDAAIDAAMGKGGRADG